MRSTFEAAVREETADILGRELSDAVWREMYTRAQRKLRHIIDHFGDDDGARSTVEYIAQLTVEAVQQQALSDWCGAMYEAKKEGADTNAGPQGHTHIIPQVGHKSQAYCGVTA